MRLPRNTNSKTERPEAEKCGNCGSTHIRRRPVEDKFPYGSGKDAVFLTAKTHAISCDDCGIDYLDADAEDARKRAVYEHLQLLLPEQLIALRSYLRLSQADFAELTRVGEASLRRWESGKQQNGSTDDYLFLLGWEENVERIRWRRSQANAQPPALGQQGTPSNRAPRFQVLEVSEEERKLTKFALIK